VAAARYAPLGHRGANPFTRAAGFSSRGGPDYYERANAETALMLLIEGVGGAAAIGEIAELDNVDVLYIGPVDLSHSLGVPGQPNHPKVVAKIEEMVELARRRGKAVGVFTNDLGMARHWIGAGVQFLTFGVDTGIIFNALRDLSATLKEMKTG
jgi:4-hydroxy-2-oxoheptanedioate aldolase